MESSTSSSNSCSVISSWVVDVVDVVGRSGVGFLGFGGRLCKNGRLDLPDRFYINEIRKEMSLAKVVLKLYYYIIKIYVKFVMNYTLPEVFGFYSLH